MADVTYARPLDDPTAEAAIGWMVEMASGEMTDGQQHAFEAWLLADPTHATVWNRLQTGLVPCGVAAQGPLPTRALTGRVLKPHPSRRALLTSVAGVLGVGATGLAVADRFLPLDAILADHVTLTAQQRRMSLSDGSELVLAPRTAVDVQYSPATRRVRLLGGEIMIKVAARSAPFHLDADGLALSTTSGTFVVENRNAILAATCIEGTAQLGSDSARSEGIARGDRVVLEGSHLQRQIVGLDVAAAWVNGLLVARDQTVATIVEKLRPYFPGVIRLDPRIAQVRATGVFLLSNPDGALDELADALGLSITRVARYWVSLGPSAA